MYACKTGKDATFIHTPGILLDEKILISYGFYDIKPSVEVFKKSKQRNGKWFLPPPVDNKKDDFYFYAHFTVFSFFSLAWINSSHLHDKKCVF